MTYSTADKLKEIKRELAQRRRAYPRFIEKGWLTSEAAARQTAILESIAADYERQAQAEAPQKELGL